MLYRDCIVTLMFLELANAANGNFRFAVFIKAEAGERLLGVMVKRTERVDKWLRIHKRIRY